MTKKISLGVMFGGVSSEHEVSLASGKNVLGAIYRDRYEVTEIGILKDGRWVIGEGALVYCVCAADQSKLPVGMDAVIAEAATKVLGSAGGADVASRLMAKLGEELSISKSRLPEPDKKGRTLAELDVVFPVLHGTMGEDGAMQGFLRVADIATVGCGILASSVCLDKIVTKEVLASHGIKQAKWINYTSKVALADTAQVKRDIKAKLGGYPVFVKPANGGSSVGIGKVKAEADLLPALQLAAQYDRKIVIEEAILGREVEIAVLGADDVATSPVVSEIIPEREFYDYEAKYLDSATRIELPAKLPDSVVERMKQIAIDAFMAVDGCGLSRIDFFYCEKSDELLLNEINTLPGFTQISQYPALMKTAGYTYEALIEELIKIGLTRHEELRALKI